MTDEKKELTVVALNSAVFGSTGGVMTGISAAAAREGIMTLTACPSSRSNKRDKKADIYIGTRLSCNLHVLIAGKTGKHGCFSAAATRAFVSQLKKTDPDVVHLHNLHGDYVNLGILFDYLGKSGLPVVVLCIFILLGPISALP